VGIPAGLLQDHAVDWTWVFGRYHDEIVAPGKQPLLLLLLGLIGGFVFIRTSTRMIRAQVKWWPGNVSAGGVHLHHELFGVILMLGTGAATFAINTVHPWRDILAAAFGVGAGLVLDEFALLLRLKDVYWTKDGRSSIDAVIVAVLVIVLLLVHAVPLGVNDPRPGELSARWFAVAIVVVNLGFTVVTALKGKPWSAFFSTFITFVGIVGALRMARPDSPWARRFYGPEKCEVATERAKPWRRRQAIFLSLIGGRPTPAAQPAAVTTTAPAAPSGATPTAASGGVSASVPPHG
jgi:FtsH-binding integral membrane protein